MFCRFAAALASRSCDVPHERHVHARSDSRSVSFFDPHAEQVLDEA
jgi:hypothetical protein